MEDDILKNELDFEIFVRFYTLLCFVNEKIGVRIGQIGKDECLYRKKKNIDMSYF